MHVVVMGDSDSGVFDSSIPSGIVLESGAKLESIVTIPSKPHPLMLIMFNKPLVITIMKM